MKLLPILIVLFLSIYANSQETKKIKNKISRYEKEIYYVLNSNETIKHGQYELYNGKQLIKKGNYKSGNKDGFWTEYIWNGNKVAEGFYKNDFKDSTWTTYHGYKSKKRTLGKYEKDKRIDIWNFYNVKGELVQKFDFSNNKLTTTDIIKDKSSIGIRGGKYNGLIFLDKSPKYIFGVNELSQFISDNFNRPEKVKEGKIIVSAIVNSDGKLSDFKVEKGLEKSIDEEALRVLKLTSGNWEQGEFEGEKVTSKLAIPITIRQ